MKWLNLIGLCITAVCALTAQSKAEEPLYNAVERIFGASNINAITGHGRMAAGVSASGELTVLTWPNPSFSDQMAYITGNDVSARTQDRFGAERGAGLFFGLMITTDSNARSLYWLRDGDQWTISQGYGPDDAGNIHTHHRSDSLDLDVRVVFSIKPEPNQEIESDVLIASVTVTKGPNSDCADAQLITYGNFSPLPPNLRIPALPLADWGLDGRNGFAGLWDSQRNHILQFHPNDQGIITSVFDIIQPRELAYGPLTRLDPEALVPTEVIDQIDESFSDGAYLAWTSVPEPIEYQVGSDSTDLCGTVDRILDNILLLADELPHLPLTLDANLIQLVRCRDEQRQIESPKDALYDIEDDLALDGQNLVLGESNGAIKTPIPLIDGTGQVHVLVALGPNARSVRRALDTTSIEPDRHIRQADESTLNFIDSIRLPDSLSDRIQTVARRSMINLRVGTDTRTGAIVASITRQPSYGADWPRDGAFFNMALDISGQSQLATKRAALYDQWQRKTPAESSLFFDSDIPTDPDTGEAKVFPAGGWEMNYYADGMPAGFYRFEIDNVGFSLWMMVIHAAYHQNPVEYLTERWMAIDMAANLLVRWRDPETGLHAPAQEDDRADFTQTLHGAITTFGSLDVAARAARFLGKDSDASRWEERAEEIRDGIIAQFYLEEEARFESDSTNNWNPGSTTSGPTGWMVWPFTLLPTADEIMRQQMIHDMEFITPALDLTADGGAYFMKNTVALALAFANDPDYGPRVRQMVDLAAAQATPDTHQFGETMTVIDRNGKRSARQQVATPHLWEGTLFYLTAMALHAPDAFFGHDAIFPRSRLVPTPEINRAPMAPLSQTGCSCKLAPMTRRNESSLALFLALFITVIKRRRRD